MFGRKSCSACGGREYAVKETACPRCADVGAQVEDWLAAHCPPSVSGQGGHVAALKAAGALWGFYGSEEGVMEGLRRWNVGCAPPWSEGELRHKAREARKGLQKEPGFLVWRPWEHGARSMGQGVKAREDVRPVAEEGEKEAVFSRKGLPFEMARLKEAAGRVGPVSREELQRRSVCRLDTVTPEFFLSGLYAPGERVLVFTKFESQGQYLWEVPGAVGRPGGAFALNRDRQVRAVRCAGLPREGNCGVWFLNQPVDGLWREKPGSQFTKAPEWTRRSENCVTGWPYMVLESDIKGIEELWISFLCGLRLPVVAMYTSGGKSVHALIRVDAVTKHHWDVVRDKLKGYLTLCGADPGVFSAVRLTRLPGCLRHGTEVQGEQGARSMEQGGGAGSLGQGAKGKARRAVRYERYAAPRRQELIYFNPQAEGDRPVMG